MAVGQKASTIAAVRYTLETRGALEYTTIVASPASDAAGFKYLAPYTGSAIGQHWMYGGKHVLEHSTTCQLGSCIPRCVLPLRRPPGMRKHTPVTSSLCTPACWSVALSSPTTWAQVR